MYCLIAFDAAIHIGSVINLLNQFYKGDKD